MAWEALLSPAFTSANVTALTPIAVVTTPPPKQDSVWGGGGEGVLFSYQEAMYL